MDYLVVFLIGAGVGIFANNKIVSIRKEKAKIQNKKGEHKKMGFRELLAWIISIILMASYSYLQADIIKVKVVKPKKSKTEQRKDSDKKEVETDKEHECKNRSKKWNERKQAKN